MDKYSQAPHSFHQNMIKKTAVLGLMFFLTITYNLLSQDLNKKGVFLISTNPFKLIYGIVNLEIEYQISPSISIELGSEYVFGHYIIRKSKHPDFIFRIGPRYHFYHDKDYGDKKDLYTGLFSGYSGSQDYNEHTSYFLGMDLGYKYQFNKNTFVNAKGLITYPIKKYKILPGIEGLLGYIVKE